MKRIAIVNQRYGLEVNGGSEYYTRLIAEHLNRHYDVEILTTAALDYNTWKNHYPKGIQNINGVKVRRFLVKRQRKMLRFRVVSKLTGILSKLGIYLDDWWIREQGPYTPDLIRYIKKYKSRYDIFIFVTYLYYTTAKGLPEVQEKAVLIPTAHDEPYIYFPFYRKVFCCPKGILFLTEEEKAFVQDCFHNETVANDVIGVGIDIPDELKETERKKKAVNSFRDKYHIDGEYLIYAGRVDVGKKCDEMFAFFQKYKKLYKSDTIQLVIIGKSMLEIPDHPDIHYLGFVSEEEKYAAIAGAKYLWLPSLYESLSIALLEGMALGTPGIVNGNCAVLRGHAQKSGGAAFYQNENEFLQCMKRLGAITETAYEKLQRKAEQYVEENYCWDVVEEKLKKILG